MCRKLSRPYGRVDRARLKRKLLDKCIAQGRSHSLSLHLIATIVNRPLKGVQQCPEAMHPSMFLAKSSQQAFHGT